MKGVILFNNSTTAYSGIKLGHFAFRMINYANMMTPLRRLYCPPVSVFPTTILTQNVSLVTSSWNLSVISDNNIHFSSVTWVMFTALMGRPTFLSPRISLLSQCVYNHDLSFFQVSKHSHCDSSVKQLVYI